MNRISERLEPQEEKPWTTCDWCGGEIYHGEEYYEIHGEILCCACVNNCRKEAE